MQRLSKFVRPIVHNHLIVVGCQARCRLAEQTRDGALGGSHHFSDVGLRPTPGFEFLGQLVVEAFSPTDS